MLGGGLNSLIPSGQPEGNKVPNQGQNRNAPHFPSDPALAPEEFFNDLKQDAGNAPVHNIPQQHVPQPAAHHEEPFLMHSSFANNADNKEPEPDIYSARKQVPFPKKMVSSQAIFLIEVDKIKPNPFQPRKYFDEQALKELANSIREHGILQPLVVSKVESDTETGTAVEYQLIAGERRLRAAKIAGLERVPVIIRQVEQKSHHLEMAIIENLQRENLDAVETARSYARLQDEFGMTQREIAVRLGKSREVVANTLRLLSLPTELQVALSKGQINESQARLLLSVENVIAQKQLFNEIISNNLTVRDVRDRVKKIHLGAQPVEPSGFASGYPSSHDIEIKNLEDKLKEVLGAEVKIESKGDAGKIVINFYSPEEIYGLIHKINPSGDNF